ncbi:MAG: hypothetical protein ACYDAD_06615 [Acidimicrobiales bacterium]
MRGFWPTRDERGVVLVFFCITLTAMLAVSALVVDLGRLWVDRRANQAVVDLAGRAAIASLPSDPKGACGAVWNYVRANLPGLPAGATTPCTSTFPTSCSSATVPADYPAAGTAPWSLIVHYPVADTEIAPLRVNDGVLCERMKVVLSVNHGTFFGGIAGVFSQTATASAVVRRAGAGTSSGIADLVVLDPTDCATLQGSGNAVIQAGTASAPGIIAVDSNGTGSNCAGSYTVTVTGNTKIQAVPTSGSSPGYIRLFAMVPGQTLCTNSGPGGTACDPAAVASGAIAPQPTQLPNRITRAFMDYRYNCKGSYPTYHGITIPGCTGANSANVDSLVSAIGATGDPAGFTAVTNCAPSTPITYPPGNYWVNCPAGYTVSGTTVDFQGGNVVFDGGITLSSGTLIVNDANPTANLPAGCQASVCPTSSSQNAAFVYVRAGDVVRSDTGSALSLNNTTLFSRAGVVSFSGGTGATQSRFVAPLEGPFTNLALWDEAAGSYTLAGGAGITISGVFFTPEATPFNIAGGSGSQQYDGQFVTYQLAVNGNASITLNPNPSRLVTTGGATTSGYFVIR